LVVPVRISKPVYIKKIENNFEITISKNYSDCNYYGFEITGNRRFVLDDFTVTHNTVLGIKIITEFSQRTLIVVDKVQLMRQWESEIKRFAPKAKIGFIQGKRFDSEGFDIVIGTLQTITLKKNLDSESFKHFGMCIIDETHHIASETFSKIMWKIRPKFLFGLTATLERKDRAEQLIKWYMGEIIFSDKNESLKQTTDIHIYKYSGPSSIPLVTRDGTAAVSSMLTNLAIDKTRTKMIIKIINGLLLDKNRNILVISDRTAQLKTIHKYLSSEISGLFIGGMKPELLKKSTESRVILGTYGMVSEGFNLPKLNTLVFATPRSSITQAIGRIFRKTHTNTTPVVIDIVDDFSIFKNQIFARKKIYKKAIENAVYINKNFEEPLECLSSELTECML
jgi:superfamily II DNA or RNA helicase